MDTDAGGFAPDPDTDMTSLEQQLFGMKVFHEDAEGVLEDPDEQHTMLHRNPSEADTVFQQGLGVPPVAVADTRIEPARAEGTRGTKRTTPPPPRRASEPPAPGRIVAVGGVAAFSGAFVAGAFALVGMVVLVLVIWLRPGAGPDRALPIDGFPAADPVAPSAPGAIRFPATFRAGDTVPRDIDPKALAALVAELRQCEGAVRITGHADQSGSSAANDAVALARAGEVRKLLAAEGLAPGRLQLASVGAAEPELEDDSREARELNRRVVVRCE